MADTKTGPVTGETSNGSKHWRTARTNLDWWPNALDLKLLDPPNPLGNPMGEDFDFLLRIAEQGSLANVPYVLYDYRQHLLNTCSAYGSGWDSYRQAFSWARN